MNSLKSQWRIQDFADGECQPKGGSTNQLFWPDFVTKLHETEKNWTEEGGARIPSISPGSANDSDRMLHVGSSLLLNLRNNLAVSKQVC